MWDRRRQKRSLLEEFVFIQIGRDDGGRVLNVSEGGLSFEVFSPIPQNGPVPFWFSSNLREKIEAFGELAWTDATRKVGGLKFLNLRPQDRERIGAWVQQVSTAESSMPPVPSVTPIPEGSSIPARAPSAPMTSLSDGWLPNAVPLQDNFAPKNAEPEVQEPGESFYASHLVPLERFLTATRRQFILGVLLGILVSSVVAVPAFKYSGYRKQVSASQAVPSSTDVGKRESQPIAPAAGSSSEPVRGPLTAAVAGNLQPAVQSGLHPYDPFASASSQPQARSLHLSSASGGQIASTFAQAHSDNSKSSKKVAATPQQLWSSVQAGNMKAAVALADLYIRGDGVPANCNQARVLLLVASEKNNTEAIRKLRELDKTGCPEP